MRDWLCKFISFRQNQEFRIDFGWSFDFVGHSDYGSQRMSTYKSSIKLSGLIISSF